MSLTVRRELLSRIRGRYQAASWSEKNRILDAFVEASGYRRKYAITILNQALEEKASLSEQRPKEIL